MCCEHKADKNLHPLWRLQLHIIVKIAMFFTIALVFLLKFKSHDIYN